MNRGRMFRFYIVWLVVLMLGWGIIAWATDFIPNKVLDGLVWLVLAIWWGWQAFQYIVAHVRAQILREFANTAPRDQGASLN